MPINIRPEETEDIEAIRRVNLDAFPQPAEANLVDALRTNVTNCISLVAEEGEEIIGHIMFSPVELKEQRTTVKMIGLAPMAVSSAHQNKGIGSALVNEGLKVCAAQGFEVVVVLGHPAFYPRFGFMPSQPHGIKSEYDAPAEAFMILAFEADTLDKLEGTIVFDKCFNDL
ncbi:MAG: GNAT family N-acetyltransferase [Rhodothermales bacterium]